MIEQDAARRVPPHRPGPRPHHPLIDAADRILPVFTEGSSASAATRLRRIGVEIRLDTAVTDVDATTVTVDGGERIEAMTKVWSAGVAAGPLAARLATASGAATDRSGRIKVNPDLTLPGHPEIFVVGDLMSLDRLPGVGQVSIQAGGYVGLIRWATAFLGRGRPERAVTARQAGITGQISTAGQAIITGQAVTAGQAAIATPAAPGTAAEPPVAQLL